MPGETASSKNDAATKLKERIFTSVLRIADITGKL